MTAFGDADPFTRGYDQRFVEEVPGAKGEAHRTIAAARRFIQETHSEELARIIVDVAGITR